MLDFNPAEFLVVGIVALLVIGPKDLPKAMRFVGQWIGKARGVARQFRSGFDSMMREAELAEMEKKWAEENARIMRDFPTTSADAKPALEAPKGGEAATPDAAPSTVEQPEIKAEQGGTSDGIPERASEPVAATDSSADAAKPAT